MARQLGSPFWLLMVWLFMGLMAVNATLIAAGIAQLEVLPAYAKNEVGIAENNDAHRVFFEVEHDAKDFARTFERLGER